MNFFLNEEVERIVDALSTPGVDLLAGVTVLLVAYLVGSIASALVVYRILGLPDPRERGSKNPGATNMLRIGGKKAAALTLGGDMLKGTASVSLAHLLVPEVAVLALLAAFLGHLYPIWFGFRGGKGMATWLGGLVAFGWLPALVAGVIWSATAGLTRYSSLASMMTVVGVFIASFWVRIGSESTIVLDRFALGLIAILVLWRHRGNIRRLIDGSESRIGRRA
ncbi:glycerol-3-phosphate 1-O-acyltransferase PlsY [Thioalkalivibrio sp. HK1]|uniref:glycerol-3-phosphate 1-O-acyltransferase PlsY n=1 Tax=Thioalkalivibrio sp. HK1 TaxID=1469245 RepID=UPI0004723639|nr:glycerol-3-phosphate 1-O-acyltransferase PlsY [Thioalkalivibrio sp. HK1]